MRIMIVLAALAAYTFLSALEMKHNTDLGHGFWLFFLTYFALVATT